MTWLRVGLMAAVLLLGVRAAQALAPEAAKDHPAPGAKDHPEAKEGDKPHPAGEGPFKGTLDVAIWTIIVFLGMFFILRAAAWGPIQQALEERERKNVEAAEAAHRAREEADALRVQLKKEQDAAERKVAETMDEARRDALRVVEEMKTAAQAEIAAERERLKREVATARDQALQEIWRTAATLATQVAGRVLPRELNDADQRRLVELALNDLQAQGDDLRALLKSREQ